jgi:predicted alpha/beta superfamily hydrolase
MLQKDILSDVFFAFTTLIVKIYPPGYTPACSRPFIISHLSLSMTFYRQLHATVTALCVILVMLCFATFGQQSAFIKKDGPAPIIAGAQYVIASAILGEKRTLNIYLPVGYHSNDTAKYPVIYLLDGGMDEDYLHVIGLVSFNSFSWVARLPPSIVVGIVNTDRRHDFTFPTSVKSELKKYPTTGGANQFIAFMEQELQLYIKSNFRVNNSRTIIGESLGGLLATQILFSKPALFDKYIVISPSLWWDNGSLLKKTINADMQAVGKKDIYLAVGKEGLAPSEEPHLMEVDVNMLKGKIESWHNNNISVYLDYLPDENHATIAHQALCDAFKWLSARQ